MVFSKKSFIFAPVKWFDMLQSYLEKGRIEAGCDEAGRGCLAGPVFAAAVVLPPDFSNELLNDSKKLTERQRYALRPIIEREAVAWAVGVCDNREIDRYNILRCSIMAMHRALDQLSVRPDFILVDGNRFLPYRDTPHQTIVKGDGKMMSIAAASILAKTYRDDFMKAQAEKYPQYHWEVNKGYPTSDHREAIRQHGPSPLHRMTFALLGKARQLTLFSLLFLLFSVLPASVFAWNPFRTFDNLMNRIDSLPPSFNTAYIYQPRNHWLIEPSIGLEGSHIFIENASRHGFTFNPVEVYKNIEAARNATSEYKIRLHTYPMPTLALRLKYRIIDFTFFSYQPDIFSNVNNDFRWKFGFNFNQFGINIYYQHTRSFHGSYVRVDSLDLSLDLPLDEGIFHEKVFEVSGYYVFNAKRFSYLAAFDQTQEQLRNAGSWMLAATFSNGRYIANSDSLGNLSMRFTQVSLGGGYAYNWITHHWLLHARTLPQLVIYPSYKSYDNGVEGKIDRSGLDFIIPIDLAAVRYWKHNYFTFSAGGEANLIGNANNRQIIAVHWRSRIAYGFRF